MYRALVLVLIAAATPALAEGFLCAGQLDPETQERTGATKPAVRNTTGTYSALVLFAQFADDRPGWTAVPAWGRNLFNPELPGSVSHFYDTMSLGKLHLTGEAAPRPYIASQPAEAYLPATPGGATRYGLFCEEIVRQADLDVDFTRFDNDGPDGVPSSGDDDGIVDAVLIVLASAPATLIRGNATGIAGLGFGTPILADDLAPGGHGVRVEALQGTVQQGRSFSEAAGAICHEFGHLLGLGDLYNTGFLANPNSPPAEDSGGVGAWDLMGWGASGWQGDDGPASLGAYSRWRLGWCRLEQVVRLVREISLPEVGRQGDLVRVPLPSGEAYLLEYRTRVGSYYDRHLPGEGLLIWHVGTTEQVDLECADGRWLDAGYPAGQVPNPRSGEDNLDFWAHDAAYAAAHQGNLGDATDPFDGMIHDSFTPEGNPSSTSDVGDYWARVERIRLTPEAVTCTVSIPSLFAVRNPRLTDANHDGILLAGEPATLRLGLAYLGLRAPSFVRLHAASNDPRLSVVSNFPERIVPLYEALPELGLRFTGEFPGVLQASLQLTVEIGSSGETAWIEDLSDVMSLVGVSPWQPVAAVDVVDSLGNGDGAAQAGEFVRPRLTLAMNRPDLLRPLSFRLWSLDPRLRPLDAPDVFFTADSGTAAVSTQSQEFLIAGTAAAGDSLRFRMRVVSEYGSWSDTLALVVAPGIDQTPPRVSQAESRQDSDLVRFSLSASLVIDGSAIRGAAVVIADSTDPTRSITVPLSLADGIYRGTWQPDRLGEFAVTTVVEDVSGNVGRSAPRALTVRDPWTTDPVTDGGAGMREVDYPIAAMAWSPDGRWLAVTDNLAIQVLASADLTPVATLWGYWGATTATTALAFAPDSRHLASGTSDGSVSVWDLETWAIVPGPEGQHRGAVEDLAYSPGGEVLASAGGGAVRLWETGRYTLEGVVFDRPNTQVLAVAYNPQGDLLATSVNEYSLFLWSAQPVPYVLAGIRGWLESVAFSPDGGLLAGAGRDGRIYVWDTDSLTASPRQIAAHTGWAKDVAFSPRGDLLASAGEDHAVMLWDVDQLGLVASLEGHTAAVTSLAFSPDGTRLAAAGMDRTVRCWTVPEVKTSEIVPLPAAPLVLDPPFPNPANQGVWIPYRVGRTMDVTLRVHDLLGQVVRVLPLGRRPPGTYLAARAAFWDGRDDHGRPVASGLYLCTVELGPLTGAPVPRKVVLLK